ncbi:MAG: winged helix DNA-binding domain-containing protein [Solirubrobacteraceae bacterium]
MPTSRRRELNRALLARQLLLERHDLPLPDALERVAGLQSQYAPTMYVGLWSRLESFERGALTRALEERMVVQATLMRATIHLVSRADYWPFALATREARKPWWLRARRGELGAEEMESAARTLRRELDGSGTVSRKEIEQIVGKDRSAGVGLWLDLVRVPPSGTWERRRADLYAAATDWVGDPPEMDADSAIEHLVRRYLGGFGPASRKDVASFTGIPLTPLRPVLERLELERVEGEDGEELLDLPGSPRPDADTPAPPRLLGTWEAALLVHARRSGVLPEEHRPKIFHVRNPHSSPTFLIDGAVAGKWRHDDGRIELEPFAKLDAADEHALREEADRLAEFHA